MKRNSIALVLAVGLQLTMSCTGSKVTSSQEPTNEDAIYNIIRYDRPLEFNLDLFDFSVPDTSRLLGAPYRPLHFWRSVYKDSLFIGIDVNYPQPGDSIGSVPWANVNFTKFFWGTLEVIAEDTSGGGSVPVRMSKRFIMKGDILAEFQKVGFDYNPRRGWILTKISDAVFSDAGRSIVGPSSIGRIEIHPQSDSGAPIVVDTHIKLLRDVPSFSMGDSVTIVIFTTDPDDIISIRYPYGSQYFTRCLTPVDSSQFVAGFRFPDYIELNHFTIDAVNAAAVDDTLKYIPNAVGVIYRVR
jgi:hypothetical protein